jgi:hypothetical protein
MVPVYDADWIESARRNRPSRITRAPTFDLVVRQGTAGLQLERALQASAGSPAASSVAGRGDEAPAAKNPQPGWRRQPRVHGSAGWRQARLYGSRHRQVQGAPARQVTFYRNDNQGLQFSSVGGWV